jgi:DNA-binding NarL/FixJ family response regulator
MEAVALEAAGDRSAAVECYELCEAVRDVARLAQATRRERRAAFGTALTSREHQVAGLVASGLTNRQISVRLSLSECTINHHVEAIFRKRGIRARWQLSADSLQ